LRGRVRLAGNRRHDRRIAAVVRHVLVLDAVAFAIASIALWPLELTPAVPTLICPASPSSRR
jgi:hypothetical protein